MIPLTQRGTLQIRDVPINESSAGDNAQITGVAGKIIYVVYYHLVPAADNILDWEDEDGNVLDGPMSFASNGGIEAENNEYGIFKAPIGKGVSLGQTVSAQVGGLMKYALV